MLYHLLLIAPAFSQSGCSTCVTFPPNANHFTFDPSSTIKQLKNELKLHQQRYPVLLYLSATMSWQYLQSQYSIHVPLQWICVIREEEALFLRGNVFASTVPLGRLRRRISFSHHVSLRGQGGRCEVSFEQTSFCSWWVTLLSWLEWEVHSTREVAEGKIEARWWSNDKVTTKKGEWLVEAEHSA